METELKPCPFCGCKAILDSWYSDGMMFEVNCTNRKCAGSVAKFYRTANEAIDAWNTRAERTCRIIKTWSDSDYVDGWRYRCSECSCFIPVNERDFETGDVISAANYCPNCGAKVVR